MRATSGDFNRVMQVVKDQICRALGEKHLSMEMFKVCHTKAIFTLRQIAFAQARKPYRIGLLFTHNNGCGGAISATERRCAAPGLLRRQLLLETFRFKDKTSTSTRFD